MPTAKVEASAALKDAGKKPGLEVWRIEKLEPVRQLEQDYGKFYSGDAYIVLSTKVKPGSNKYGYDIHFWLGTDCSQDESGAAALRTVELDELVLNSSAVQYRETQDHESKLFLSYFKAGIRYLSGGVDSALKHVDAGEFERRLFQVKGKKNVRVGQIKCELSSLNQADTFVLDCGRNIYVWIGPKSENKERLVGVEAAKRIRDDERGGKAQIDVIEVDWQTNDEFFEALGEKSAKANEKRTIKEGNDSEDDEKIIAQINQETRLFQISDGTGELTRENVKELTEKPFKRAFLDSKFCYVLAAGPAGIYVWMGKQCPTQFKAKVWDSVNKFIDIRGYPRWIAVTKVIDGGETAFFKQYFEAPWDTTSSSAGAATAGASRIAQQDHSDAASIDSATLHGKAKKTEQWMPDDGSGTTQVWRVVKHELVEVPKAAYGVFCGEDCYIILYKYAAKSADNKGYIIYFWQGQKSSTADKTACAGQVVTLDNKLGGNGVQIRVVMFKEPAHFMKLFGGKLVVYMSGSIERYRHSHDRAGYDPQKSFMFQIRGESEGNVRAIEVTARGSFLNSNDLFVVVNQKETFVWLGKYCSEAEKNMARYMAKFLSSDRAAPPIIMNETNEPDSFWSAIGGREPYFTGQKQLSASDAAVPPRLFHCSMSSGRFTVEEIVDFCQDDLDETDVMILDTYDEIFIWLGAHCTEFEKKESAKTAHNYLTSDPAGRTPDNTLIMVVKQGFEPPQFTGCFMAWDVNRWANGKTFNELVAEVGEKNAGVSLLQDEVKKYKSFYPLNVLQGNPLPEGVDPVNREMYLIDADFIVTFGMTKEEYAKLPQWKQIDLKKKHNLF